MIPFVSVLQAYSHWRHANKSSRQIVTLIWSCREPGLLDHVLNEYLAFLWNEEGNSPSTVVDCGDVDTVSMSSLRIICHYTGFVSAEATSSSSSFATTAAPMILTPSEECRGHALEQAQFDWLNLSGFLIVIWTGVVVEAWQYLYRIPGAHKSVRAQSIWICMATAFTVAILMRYPSPTARVPLPSSVTRKKSKNIYNLAAMV